jgi:hypothetical protein
MTLRGARHTNTSFRSGEGARTLEARPVTSRDRTWSGYNRLLRTPAGQQLNPGVASLDSTTSKRCHVITRQMRFLLRPALPSASPALPSPRQRAPGVRAATAVAPPAAPGELLRTPHGHSHEALVAALGVRCPAVSRRVFDCHGIDAACLRCAGARRRLPSATKRAMGSSHPPLSGVATPETSRANMVNKELAKGPAVSPPRSAPLRALCVVYNKAHKAPPARRSISAPRLWRQNHSSVRSVDRRRCFTCTAGQTHAGRWRRRVRRRAASPSKDHGQVVRLQGSLCEQSGVSRCCGEEHAQHMPAALIPHLYSQSPPL